MIRGAREKLGDDFGAFDVACDSTMPAGAPTCHFMWRGRQRMLTDYSRSLEEGLTQTRGTQPGDTTAHARTRTRADVGVLRLTKCLTSATID
jgi:hypothetical protein